MARYLLLGCILCAVPGCTSMALRRDSVGEARAVVDMQTQQVLNNLAMFCCNPNAMPYFSFPNATSTTVADTGSASAGPSFGFGASSPVLSGVGLSFLFSRAATEGFTVTPITDPRKLELMRGAYQTAIASCGRGAVSTTCPDCQTRFNMFYTGDPNGDIRANANGIVTSECLKSDRRWFHVGCKKCLPKHCECLPMGQYCDVYVWVCPDGRDQLTKLTLAILDYAYNNPPQQLTKTVTYYIDAYGLPTTQSASVGTVAATIGISERPESLLNTPVRDLARLERDLDVRLRSVRETLAASQDTQERQALLAKMQAVQAELDFLREQIRAGALKSQFSVAAPTFNPSAGLLNFQQQLQTLAPAAH